jgi:hypothetical protein
VSNPNSTPSPGGMFGSAGVPTRPAATGDGSRADSGIPPAAFLMAAARTHSVQRTTLYGALGGGRSGDGGGRGGGGDGKRGGLRGRRQILPLPFNSKATLKLINIKS